MRLLVTGGAGFIGSQVVRECRARSWDVVVLDCLTYAGRMENLEGVPCTFVYGDVCDKEVVLRTMAGCDAVLHLAAESHVARSLGDASPFFRTNILGTQTVLSAALECGIERVVHMSTDEVFGAAVDGAPCGPDSPMRPGNPYAASKVGAEAAVFAWRHSFGSHATIVRCTNNYGPRQHLEKAIPCWAMAARAGGPVSIHGAGVARRDWLHVADCARGLVDCVEHWERSAIRHFAGRDIRRNRDVAQAVCDWFGGRKLVSGPERPGQDAVYLLDDQHTRDVLGWAPRIRFDEGLSATLDWYSRYGTYA